MGLNADMVRSAIGKAANTARLIEGELNEADSRLGDGDTGLSLRRLLERLETTVRPDGNDLGEIFQVLAAQSAEATGSSLGTLITIAMLTLARDTRGLSELPWAELGDRLARVRDAMMSRGKAALGDKTIIDIIDSVAREVAGLQSADAIKRAARFAAHLTLDNYRRRPCRVGRARMFADKSIGMDDPGMLALVRLIDGLDEEVKAG